MRERWTRPMIKEQSCKCLSTLKEHGIDQCFFKWTRSPEMTIFRMKVDTVDQKLLIVKFLATFQVIVV